MVVGLTGRVAVELLRATCAQAAEGGLPLATLAAGLLRCPVPTTAQERHRLAALVEDEATGEDAASSLAAALRQDDGLHQRPWSLTRHALAAGNPSTGGDAEPTDADFLSRLRMEPAAVAAWATWQVPAVPVPWPPPARLHVVAVDASPNQRADELLVLSARLSATVFALGSEPPSLVEVLAASDSVWVRDERPPVRVAGSPSAEGDLLPLADAEILLAKMRTADVLLDGDNQVRTDGTWVWRTSHERALQDAARRPEPALQMHLAASTGGPVGLVDRLRALHEFLGTLP